MARPVGGTTPPFPLKLVAGLRIELVYRGSGISFGGFAEGRRRRRRPRGPPSRSASPSRWSSARRGIWPHAEHHPGRKSQRDLIDRIRFHGTNIDFIGFPPLAFVRPRRRGDRRRHHLPRAADHRRPTRVSPHAFHVGRDNAGERLDVALRRARGPGLSKAGDRFPWPTAWCTSTDSRRTRSTCCTPAMRSSGNVPPQNSSSTEQQNFMPFTIVYSGGLAAHHGQPAGVVVHPAPGPKRPAGPQAGRRGCARRAESRPGDVHRLDRFPAGGSSSRTATRPFSVWSPPSSGADVHRLVPRPALRRPTAGRRDHRRADQAPPSRAPATWHSARRQDRRAVTH